MILQRTRVRARSHENAVHFRIGKRHFGCSVCDYTYWSHKTVDRHIEGMLKYEQCPAPWNHMGEYMSDGIEEYCAVCNKKRECEIEVLTYNIAIMDILSPGDPDIEPLFGWNEQDKIRNKCLTRIAELMNSKEAEV